MTDDWHFTRNKERQGPAAFAKLKEMARGPVQTTRIVRQDWVKKVTATICLETLAFGRGRVASGDRQMVAGTFSQTAHAWESPVRRIR
jgi:hypothetical protein